MLTDKVVRNSQGRLLKVNNGKVPDHLKRIRIPPAWEDLMVETDPDEALVATGYDVKGRRQYLYSPEHVNNAKEQKFIKIRKMIEEHEEIRSEIESMINDHSLTYKTTEAAMVAYLIYETGIRPGSTSDTLADVQAYGATTLQLRHVKPATNGVRLKFTGKKGVKQSVLVTNPFLVEVMLERKLETTAYTTPLFDCSSAKLREVVSMLGDGSYTPKDLRTMRGTMLAMDLIGWRVRVPKTKKARKKVVNDMLDKVASKLGNTRAITKSAYVDPAVYSRFVD